MNMSYYGNLMELIEDIKKDCGGYEWYGHKASGNRLNVYFVRKVDGLNTTVCEATFVFEKNLIEGSYVVDEDIYDFSVKTGEKLHHLFARLG